MYKDLLSKEELEALLADETIVSDKEESAPGAQNASEGPAMSPEHVQISKLELKVKELQTALEALIHRVDELERDQTADRSNQADQTQALDALEMNEVREPETTAVTLPRSERHKKAKPSIVKRMFS